MRGIVSEIYSARRVTAAAKFLPELKVTPGLALDLTTSDSGGRPWDFDEKEMRNRALPKIRDERPMLLIGSPTCTAFSTWQRINNQMRDPYGVAAELKRATTPVEFCFEVI